MSSAEFTDPSNQIGTSVHIQGDVYCDADLVVSGHVEGNVSAVNHEIVVGGQVDGDLRARVLVIAGRVHGNVYASERVELHPGCRVAGDLVSPRIALHEGALLSGSVRMANPASEPARRESEPRPGRPSEAVSSNGWSDGPRPGLSALPFR